MEILKKIKFNSTFLLFIFCYSLLTVGSTYAFLEFDETNGAVSGIGGCTGVNYTGEEITGASLSGGTSYLEGSSSIVTLSKDEDCAIYTVAHIKIHTDDTITAPITGSTQALRYKVEKISGDGEILSGGEGFINQIGDMTLATVSLTENVTTYKVYIWLDVTLTNGLYNDTTYSGYIFAESEQTSTIAPDTAPDAPIITRVDYDTFTYSATDNITPIGYYVSTNNTTPTVDSNWTTIRTYDISGTGTYYVWAIDINNNISEAASISAYTITRSVGTGSSLITRYDSISEDTGTEFTSSVVVLEGTPVYVEAVNNSGYANPILTSTGGTVTNGSSVSITGDTTFTSSATFSISNISYDYNHTYTYKSAEYMNTGYTINWDEDFSISATINVSTLGKRYLIIGNYDNADLNAFNIEIANNNTLRFYVGTGEVDEKSSSVITAGEDIVVVFNWNASTDTYTISATGTTTSISFNGTYSLSGISSNTLRVGTLDYRSATSPFNEITLSSLKITHSITYGSILSDLPMSATRTGYGLTGWYTAVTGGTEVTNTSTYTGDSDVTYYVVWQVYKVIIKYNVNGGSLISNATNTYSVDNDGNILSNENGDGAISDFWYIYYGQSTTSSGLANYNNPSYINIIKTNQTASSGAEWKCLSGDCTVGTTYSHSSVYSADSFCDASLGDCTAVLGVNWVTANYSIEDSDGIVTEYAVTLANAISAASAGDTITLLRNYTDTSTVTFNKNINFYSNGYVLTRNLPISVSSGNNVSIIGNSDANNDIVFSSMSNAHGIVVSGTLTLSSAIKISYSDSSSTGNPIYINSGGSLISSNSLIYSTNESMAIWNVSGSVTVTNITMNASGGIGCEGSGNLTFNNGTFTENSVAGDPVFGNWGTGTMTINNGNFVSNTTGVRGVSNKSSGTIVVNGGTFTCGAFVCGANDGTGELRILGGTMSSGSNTLYNSSTGNLHIGTYYTPSTATIKGTGDASATVFCGALSDGSRAYCTVAGATITATSSTAITNKDADLRIYNGSVINNVSSGETAVVNRGTTYTSVAASSSSDGVAHSYGRVYVRQGFIHGGKNGITSYVEHNSGVTIGNDEDTHYTTYDNSKANGGPIVLGKTNRGIYIDNTDYKYKLANGYVGGATEGSNVTPNSGRTGYSVSTTSTKTIDSVKYTFDKLVAD